jgi:DNA sulfur modification protein DndC
MILGVREGESNSRDRVLDSHTIEGKELMRHTTQANSFVFAPIRNFTKDDVWNYLLTKKSPWGSDNTKLFKLYQDSLTGEECPIMMSEDDKKKTTCGNSRFGCWVCTVVNEDKSLTGFIKSGVKWLKPLLEYRNWLFSIRDEQNRRMHCRRNGSLYFSKLSTGPEGDIVISAKGDRVRNVIRLHGTQWIDDNNEVWHVFETGDVEQLTRNYIVQNNIDLRNGDEPRIIIKKVDDCYYRLGVGPFTMETRKEMLDRLLCMQKSLSNGYQLIKMDELKMIQKLWYEEGDIENSVFSIYKKYFDDYELVNDDIQLLSSDDYAYLKELCESQNVDFSIFKELLDFEKVNVGYHRRVEVIKKIKERLNQEYLTLGQKEDSDED